MAPPSPGRLLDLLDWLEGRRVAHRPFWIANLIWARADLATITAIADRLLSGEPAPLRLGSGSVAAAGVGPKAALLDRAVTGDLPVPESWVLPPAAAAEPAASPVAAPTVAVPTADVTAPSAAAPTAADDPDSAPATPPLAPGAP